MTWTRLSDDLLSSPVMLDLPRDARLLHVEVMTYSNRYGLDGRITLANLRRCTDLDTAHAEVYAASLVSAGLWTRPEPDGPWQVDWSEQFTAEDVAETRTTNLARKRRNRRHQQGNHSECLPGRPCSPARGRTTTDPSPTELVTKGSRQGSSAPATVADPPPVSARHLSPVRALPVLHPWSDDCCALPSRHPVHAVPEQHDEPPDG